MAQVSLPYSSVAKNRPTRSMFEAILEHPLPLLCLVCVGLFVYGIGTAALHRTETLRAAVAHEMTQTGNYLVPTLYGETFLTKPPLMYLAIVATSFPFGEVTPLSARLPSVLAASASVFLFFGFFSYWLDRRAGLLAALVLPMSLLWLDRAPSAEIDMLQLFWASASLLCFLRALELAESRQSRRASWQEHGWMQLAMLSMAAGLLTKWTAPGFFYLTVVPLLVWRGRLRLLFERPHFLGLLTVVILVGGWMCAVIAHVGWTPLCETVMREALLRLSPTHHPRPYPWGELVTFPLTMVLAVLPWSLLALRASRLSFANCLDERGRRLWQLLLCWAWINLLFWTLVPGHRPRHCLPLQPALAGLGVLAWLAWQRGQLDVRPRWLTAPRLLAVMCGLWLVVKVVHVEIVKPARQEAVNPVPTGQRLAELVPSDEPIHIVGLKDDGILFYSRRRAVRFSSMADLSDTPQCGFCLLTQSEWQASQTAGLPFRSVASLHDAQGDRIVLACRRIEFRFSTR